MKPESELGYIKCKDSFIHSFIQDLDSFAEFNLYTNIIWSIIKLV